MKNIFISNTLGVQIFQIIAMFGSLTGILYYDISSNELIIITFGYFLYGCLGIVIMFHRYLTHNSYKTYNYIIKLFSTLGCLGGTGSPIAWVSIHINHHLNSDKPSDPHSPHFKGYKIFKLNYENEIDSSTKWKMKYLITDKFQQLLHRFYFLILIFYGFLLYMLGDCWLLIFLFLIPAFITGIMSNIVNYFGHMPTSFGSYRRYNLNDKSSNNWVLALPSWGESWHNNHHRFPKKSYFGKKWYEIDISGLLINLIKK